MSKPAGDAQLIEHRTLKGNRAAIVFVHGFGGDASATWGKFPQLLKECSQLEGWNIGSVGYPTRLRLDPLAGIWSANPDLSLLALGFDTACKTAPLDTGESLAIIAHSMGGLVVQRALLDYPALLQRVSHLFLFGTPSGGLEKRPYFSGSSGKSGDMSPENPFIQDLRKRWRDRFGVPNQGALSYNFWCVAGLEDEFVPYNSSLRVFPRDVFPKVQLAAVPGNHIQIVKPADANNRGVQLVMKALLGKAAPAGPWNSAAVALAGTIQLEGGRTVWRAWRYLVASFDNRGTPAPKGRAWRKVIYGSVGVLASKEQAAAVRTLAASRRYVDLERVGVFGWSGGGSFKVGVAGAPVPNQTLYDSIYQERYMGLPKENADGYKNGSPINFAGGLQGNLLIIHGTGDDNVHFQGTQRLLNKLIELNKQFSFIKYPNRRHGISGAHLDTLRYGFLEEHLPAVPRWPASHERPNGSQAKTSAPVSVASPVGAVTARRLPARV